MVAPLDILLLESEAGDGDADAVKLEAAGHRVHRCWPVRGPGGGRQSQRDRYLCSSVVSGDCPLDHGIDVVLLVRGQLRTSPTLREVGVSCAVRAGIPIVEDGPSLLDPFAPWVTARAGQDVCATCEEVARIPREDHLP
jgi:hypothetical protein